MSRGTVTTAMRVLLGLSAAIVVIFSLWPSLMSPSRVDLSRGIVPTSLIPKVGRSVIAVPVEADSGLLSRLQQAGSPGGDVFPIQDSPNGSVDATTGRPPVDLALLQQMRLTLWGPGTAGRWAFVAPDLAGALVILAVIWRLWQLVSTIAREQVFTPANARRIVHIGLLVGIGGALTQLITYWCWSSLIDNSAAAGVVRLSWSFTFIPVWVGAVIVALSEVFRQGVRLQTDVEGLV